MTGRRRLAMSIGAALILAVGCASGGRTGAPLPPQPPVVAVTMREYRFEYQPPPTAGRVVFRFVNDGRTEHQPDLLPLAEDLPPIDEQLRGEERATVTPFAGIPPRRPGEDGTYAVDLVPGRRYAFICFARDPDDDESHALQGMSTEFRAGGAATATTGPPAADPTTTPTT